MSTETPSFLTCAKIAAVTISTLYYFYHQHTTTQTTAATIQRLTELLAAERRGRTTAERNLGSHKRSRQQITKSNTSLPTYTFSTVAIARTLFVDRRGCPRQGSLTPSAVGWLDISKHIPRASFESLEQFSHVWVTFVFDRNTNVHKASPLERTFKAKVRPPLLGGKKVGLFATRSPHRPNPIGLTLCKLDRIDFKTGRIYLSGIDLCDGTPVLDIKPYVCHDRPNATDLKYAAWVPSKEQSQNGDVGAPLNVLFRSSISEQLEMLLPKLHQKYKACVVYFSDVQATLDMITEVLRLDIRGLTQKRGANGSGMYTCRLGVLTMMFTVLDGNCWVESIAEV